MFYNVILLALFNAYYLIKMQYNMNIGGVLMAFQLKQNNQISPAPYTRNRSCHNKPRCYLIQLCFTGLRIRSKKYGYRRK